MAPLTRRAFVTILLLATNSILGSDLARPNIVLVMADDQGWGQTGYYNHPALKTPRVTKFPAVTMDIFPTIAAITGLPESVTIKPQDGISLLRLCSEEIDGRDKPIPFHCLGNSALISNHFKLICLGKSKRPVYELYDLDADPKEEHNLYATRKDVAQELGAEMDKWHSSMEASIAGKDYPAGRLLPGDPQPQFWMDVDAYRPYFDAWKVRPEHASRLSPKKPKRSQKK